jgi:hypothetical protein
MWKWVMFFKKFNVLIMGLSSELIKLIVAAPLTKFLVKKDVASKGYKRPISSRLSLNIAIIVCLSLSAHPFVSKPANLYEKFNAIVAADSSTVYQQFRRTQTWIDRQMSEGKICAEEGEFKKAENEELFKRIKTPALRQYYTRFGDIIDYSKPIEEPSFMFVAGQAINHVVFFISIVVGLCYYLPMGGLLTIFIFLLAIFCLEIECRFISPESLFEYIFFLNGNEWTIFEAINALKEALVGVVCAVIIANGLFGDSLDATTKNLIRKVLRTNASIVTVLKDENIMTAPKDTEEDDDAGKPRLNFGNMITKAVGLVALFSSVFLRSE